MRLYGRRCGRTCCEPRTARAPSILANCAISFREPKILDDRLAQANESLGREGQPLAASKEKTPAAFELAFAQRQGAKRALSQFLLCHPGRKDADTEAE